MLKIKKIFFFFLILFFLASFSACACGGNEADEDYFYFEKGTIDLYVGDSQNILFLAHQTNVDESALSIFASDNLEVNNLVVTAQAKGNGYVQIYFGKKLLASIEVRIYQNVQQEEAQDNSQNNAQEDIISYTIISRVDGFYVVEITKSGSPYTNFSYECENKMVEINIVSGNTLYISAQEISSFSITIKDKLNFTSLSITLPKLN